MAADLIERDHLNSGSRAWPYPRAGFREFGRISAGFSRGGSVSEGRISGAGTRPGLRGCKIARHRRRL
jgi:hypothetical protein